MDTSLRLRDIFTDRLFRIPDYQRGYAWGEKELTDFWEDLEVLPKDRIHYTGSFFLERSRLVDDHDQWITESGFGKFDVVDGQQRLTTIVILLNELIGRLTDEGGYCQISKKDLVSKYLYRQSINGNLRSYIVNYMAKDPNFGHLNARIFGNPTAIAGEQYNGYSRNLDFAKEYFRKKIDALSETDRNELFFKITNSLRFDLREVEADIEVESVFETMNNRGKKLTILERLKNRLIYLVKYLDPATDCERQALRDKIHQTWGVVYAEMARNRDDILDEDDFFVSHLSLYMEPEFSVFSTETAEDKVFKVFSLRAERNGELPVSYQSIDRYLASLAEIAHFWSEIHNSARNDVLKRILCLTTQRDVKIFLVALKKVCGERTKVESMLAKVERILFRNRVPGMHQFDERDFATWARDLYSEERGVEEVEAWLDELWARSIDVSSFVASIGGLFNYIRGNHGYHRWNELKYFLFSYDESLRSEFGERDTRIDFDAFACDTIEHVIPQSWQNNWECVFDPLEPMEKTEYDYRKAIINSLGNLTILYDGKNSSLGDKDWETKKARYRTGSYNEIEIARNETWDLRTLHLRGLKMLDFLVERTGCPSLNDDQKYKALYAKDTIVSAMKSLVDGN